MSRLIFLSLLVVALSIYCSSLYSRSTPPYGVIDVVPYRKGSIIKTIISDIAHIYEAFGGNMILFVKYASDYTLTLTRAPLDNDVKAKFVDMVGIPVRMYEPVEVGGVDTSNNNGRGALIYFHGGGFKLGNVYIGEGFANYFVHKMGMIVFSVEYRYAPEHPSPTPFADSLKVVKYIFNHAREYNVDPQRISVSGDSAGGNLAAAISQKLRDDYVASRQNEDLYTPQFCAQVLLVPWLQGVDFNLPSYQKNRDLNQPSMTANGMAIFTLTFLNKSREHAPYLLNNRHVTQQTRKLINKVINWSLLPEDIQSMDYKQVIPKEINTALAQMMESALLNAYNFPLMAENLAGLPPAFILVEENDVLRDEGLIYAARLEGDGGDVTLYRDTKGHHCMVHGTHNHKAMQEVMVAITAFLDNKCR